MRALGIIRIGWGMSNSNKLKSVLFDIWDAKARLLSLVIYKLLIGRKHPPYSYPCTLKVRPLAVFLSFSSFSGLALLSTASI